MFFKSDKSITCHSVFLFLSILLRNILASPGLDLSTRSGKGSGQPSRGSRIGPGRPRGMEWGGRREEGSGWGTHVYLWQIHFDIWQN